MPKYDCTLPKVRVYKGSRYIPKFADPLQWDANTAYEHLTVVYSCGRTYISKVDVPTGSPLPKYPKLQNEWWATYADYNAQLEMYREEVRTFSTRYDEMFCWLKDQLEKLDAKVDRYYTELNTKIDNLRQYVDTQISNVRNEMNHLETDLNNTINNLGTKNTYTFADIINKVYGGGTLGEDGHISWPNSSKIAVGDLNIYSGYANGGGSGDYSNAIRSRSASDNDLTFK